MSSSSVPQDADDLRGYHFRRLLRSRLILYLGGFAALATFVAISIAGSPLIGLAAAAVVALIVLVIVWVLASSRAESDFFKAYAQGRGLAWADERSMLPPMTPLLCKGDERYAEKTLRGRLPGGADGTIALYTYEEESRDSDGNKQTTYHHFTLALSEIPETAAFIGDLLCQRRAGFRFLDSAEDVFRKRQRVELESVDADRRYEIFAGEDEDLNRVRQVFEPTFIVWLAEHAPEDFAFELGAGWLVCNVKGHQKSAADLDSLCESASVVVTRLRSEATELA